MRVRKRLVFVVLLGLVVLGALFSGFAWASFRDSFAQLAEQKRYLVDTIAGDLDEDIELWGDYKETFDVYQRSLATDMETIDQQPHTLGVMYSRDLERISRRLSENGVPEEEKNQTVDPLTLNGFRVAVESSASGWWVGSTEFGEMRIYYRWVPTKLHDYLLVAGVSERGVVAPPAWVAVVYDGLVLVLCVWVVIDLVQGRKRGE